MIKNGSSIYLGGTFLNVGGVTARRIAKVNDSTGAIDESFSNNFENQIFGFFIASSTLYVFGAYLSCEKFLANGFHILSQSSGDKTNEYFSAYPPDSSAYVGVISAVTDGILFTNTLQTQPYIRVYDTRYNTMRN